MSEGTGQMPHRRLLVIDDNRVIHDDFCKIFASESDTTKTMKSSRAALFGTQEAESPELLFELDTASQGREGLERVRQALAEKRPYSLAFVDIRMPPGWDGVETVNRIWAVDPDLQIVICSAYSDYSWTELTCELDRTDQFVILKKPFDDTEVRQLAWVLTEKWHLARLTQRHVADLEETVEARTASLRETNERLRSEIREREQAEATLREKDDQLRQAQKMEAVGALAGGVAHEYNNLLQAIRGYSMLAREQLSPKDQPYHDLEQVLQAAEQAATLTNQLLGFGRRQTFKPVTLDLKQVVVDGSEMLRPLLGEHIDMQVSVDEGVGTVHADPTMLQQIIMNLCVNARDAMPDGGELHVRTSRVELGEPACSNHFGLPAGSYAVMAVSDTGHGISAEVQERIFEPFYTTKQVGRGTGLGLSTVHGFVTQLGGTIRVDSELGHGTTFTVYLPIATAEVAGPTVQNSRPLVGGTETVLLAEDEPVVRNFARRVLESAGYNVLLAADGAEAVRVFEENVEQISLAVLDLVMPKLTGREVFDQITQVNPDVHVTFCTGYDPEASQTSFIAEHQLALIEKPFDPYVFLQTIRDTLDGVPVS